MNDTPRTTLHAWRMAALSLVLSAPALAGGGAAGDKFKKMDTNNDGTVSATEYAASVSTKFAEMDADRDGNLTAAEMDARRGPAMAAQQPKEPVTYNDASMDQGPMHREPTTAEKIAKMDTSGDGMLSAAEHEAGAQTMFAELDTDGSGSLSHQELANAHATVRKEKEKNKMSPTTP